MPTYRVFGDLTVVQDDGAEQSVTGRQAAALALLLSAHPDGVTRDRLIDQIWGDDQPIDPEASFTQCHLETSLHRGLRPGQKCPGGSSRLGHPRHAG